MSTVAATWIKLVLDVVRVSWQIQLGLFISSLVVVALPGSLVGSLGIATVVQSIRVVCFFLALLMFVLLVINGSELVVKHVRTERGYMGVLRDLSEDERDLLREYIHNNTKTQSFPISHGVASGLECQGVLFRASNASHPGSVSFPYNIQPWAWHRLKKHPELLK